MSEPIIEIDKRGRAHLPYVSGRNYVIPPRGCLAHFVYLSEQPEPVWDWSCDTGYNAPAWTLCGRRVSDRSWPRMDVVLGEVIRVCERCLSREHDRQFAETSR